LALYSLICAGVMLRNCSFTHVLISVEYSYARNANETERIYKLDVLAIAIF